jgi:hypothetical protein
MKPTRFKTAFASMALLASALPAYAQENKTPTAQSIMFNQTNESLTDRLSNEVIAVPARTIADPDKHGSLIRVFPRTVETDERPIVDGQPVPPGDFQTCTKGYTVIGETEELATCPPISLIMNATYNGCTNVLRLSRDGSSPTVFWNMDPNYLLLKGRSGRELINNINANIPADIKEKIAFFAEQSVPRSYLELQASDLTLDFGDYKAPRHSLVRALREEQWLRDHMYAEADPDAKLHATLIGTNQHGFGVYGLTLKRFNDKTQEEHVVMRAVHDFGDFETMTGYVRPEDEAILDNVHQEGTVNIFYSNAPVNGYRNRTHKFGAEMRGEQGKETLVKTLRQTISAKQFSSFAQAYMVPVDVPIAVGQPGQPTVPPAIPAGDEVLDGIVLASCNYIKADGTLGEACSDVNITTRSGATRRGTVGGPSGVFELYHKPADQWGKRRIEMNPLDGFNQKAHLCVTAPYLDNGKKLLCISPGNGYGQTNLE